MAFSSPEGQTPQKGQWLQDRAGLSRDTGAWELWCPRGWEGLGAWPPGGAQCPAQGVGGARAAQSGTPYQVGSRGHGPGYVQA